MDGAIARPRQAPAALVESIKAITRQKLSRDAELVAFPAKILSRLNPSFALDSETFIAITQDTAGIDRSHLGTRAQDLSALRVEVVAAVDSVLSGISLVIGGSCKEFHYN